MRAVLAACATMATLTGLRAMTPLSQALASHGLALAWRAILTAPSTISRRRL